MKDLSLLKLDSKVKLKLIQPQFKCSGRDDVTFQTRGKIVDDSENFWEIEFKSKGKLESELFSKSTGYCTSDIQFIDLKIV